MPADWTRRSLAEFVGAFTLTFVGAGAIMTAHGIGDPSLIGIALAHGLAIGVMVTAVGHVSGGHFNPAVTFGFLLARRIEPALAAAYWLSQLAGATIAALLLWWIFPDQIVDAVKLGAPGLGTGVSVGAGFVVEAILTFLLVWVIFAAAVDERGAFRPTAGLAIGLTITAAVLVGGPLTGAAINPSRAFGPMLVHGVWGDGWIWYVGPLAGGGAAALLYERVYLRAQRAAA